MLVGDDIAIGARIEELRERAASLAEEREAVLREIGRLEREAAGNPHRVEVRAAPSVFEKRVEGRVAANPGIKTGGLCEALGAREDQVRAALLALEQRKLLVRTGIKRGTRWWTPAAVPEGAIDADVRDYRALVRDAAIRLGVFTFDELKAALPGASEATVRRWVAYWETQGTFYGEVVGKQKLFEWIKPPTDRAPRPRRKPPEEVLKGKEIRPQGIAGTGRSNWRTRLTEPGRVLLAELESAGCKVTQAARSTHIKVLWQGNYVGTLPVGRTDPGIYEAARKQFVENGVPLPDRTPA